MWVKTLFSMDARKAWLAAIGAIVSALVVGARDDVLDTLDYLTAIEAGVIALGVVFSVPNASKKSE